MYPGQGSILVANFTPVVFREAEADPLRPSIIVASIVLGFLLLVNYIYIKGKRQKADSAWIIKDSEMSFSSPPKVIGSGTLGVVVLAEYRSTAVVVKRVVPPRKVDSRRNNGGGANFISV